MYIAACACAHRSERQDIVAPHLALDAQAVRVVQEDVKDLVSGLERSGLVCVLLLLLFPSCFAWSGLIWSAWTSDMYSFMSLMAPPGNDSQGRISKGTGPLGIGVVVFPIACLRALSNPRHRHVEYSRAL